MLEATSDDIAKCIQNKIFQFFFQFLFPRFDTELQLLQDELRQERLQKERAVRERDAATTEKLNADQTLQVTRVFSNISSRFRAYLIWRVLRTKSVRNIGPVSVCSSRSITRRFFSFL